MKKQILLLMFLNSFSAWAQNPQPNPVFIQPNDSGIFFHQVMVAYSTDSVNWSLNPKVLFDHASVPDAVIRPDGTIFLYYMSVAGAHHMGVSVSTDGGVSWKTQEVLFDDKIREQYVDPNPVLMPDGRIRLFYLANFRPMNRPNADRSTDEHLIKSAISTDGIHFSEEPGVRFTHPNITDPDVYRTKEGWRMVVSDGRTAIMTVSTDGMNFTREDYPVSTDGAVTRTIAVDGGYRMFKCTNDGISSQFTKDFQSWREEGVRIPREDAQGMICDPGIIQLADGTYQMYLKRVKEPSKILLMPSQTVPLPPGKKPLYHDQKKW